MHYSEIYRDETNLLRVHFYEPNTNEIAIHSHRTNISSVVLGGYLINERYKVQEQREGTHQQYVSFHNGESCGFRADDTTKYIPTLEQTETLNKGDTLDIEQGELHLVRIPESTITLCLFYTDTSFSTSKIYFTPLEYKRETDRMDNPVTNNQDIIQNQILQLRQLF